MVRKVFIHGKYHDPGKGLLFWKVSLMGNFSFFLSQIFGSGAAESPISHLGRTPPPPPPPPHPTPPHPPPCVQPILKLLRFRKHRAPPHFIT